MNDSPNMSRSDGDSLVHADAIDENPAVDEADRARNATQNTDWDGHPVVDDKDAEEEAAYRAEMSLREENARHLERIAEAEARELEEWDVDQPED